MSDNIMPHPYFKTLLPQLSTELSGLEMFYEQKANMSLQQVITLKNAGIISIETGIESLSTSILKLMDKGASARQNLFLIRNARAIGLDINWTILWGFPGEPIEAYKQILALLPLMHHLQPPSGLFHISIDRFCPYFSRPKEYGIENLKPLHAYTAVFPQQAPLKKIAYHFSGEYECETYHHPKVLRNIAKEIKIWHQCWESRANSSETLRVSQSGNHYILNDHRTSLGEETFHVLDQQQAKTVLNLTPYRPDEGLDWCLEQKFGVLVDGWYVPLATANPELLLEFDKNKNN